MEINKLKEMDMYDRLTQGVFTCFITQQGMFIVCLN